MLPIFDRAIASARRAAPMLVLLAVVALISCSMAPQAIKRPQISAPAPVAAGPPPIPTADVASAAPLDPSPSAASPTTTAVPAPAPPSATPAAPEGPTALPSRPEGPTALPSRPEPLAIDAVPFAPLSDQRIVDRPARAMRAVTDGARRYRLALWSPNSPWIAAVPQDGPGMDIVNADTGTLLAVTDNTFVLEPVWASERPGDGVPCLVLHLLENGEDRLDLVCIEGTDGDATLRSETLLRSSVALRAPAYAGGTLAYATDQSFVLAARDAPAYPPALPGGGALAAALSDDRDRPSVAWTPWAAVLTQVQTLIQRPGEARPYAVTARGEGWWLPRWAPGGEQLVLSSVQGRVGTTVVDGSARFDLGPGIDPQWSPDGERIAFAGQGAGTEYTSRDIFVVDWQAAGPRLRLTRAGDEEIFVSPSWSPSGDRIAFVEIDTGQIYAVDAP